MSSSPLPTSEAQAADSREAQGCPVPPGPVDICDFVRERRLDSFQKLRLVLWLGRNPGGKFSSQQLGAALHLSDQRLMDDLVAELVETGVVCRDEGLWALADLPELQRCIDCLAIRFEDPLLRQKLLDYIGYRHDGYHGLHHSDSSAG